MGMYTELIFGAKLKEETPKEIIDTLHFMLSNSDNDETAPDNLPAKGTRTRWMCSSGGSYYFGAISGEHCFRFDKIAKAWRLNLRFNIKNYENEIESFLEWIKPWIEQGSGIREFYAIVCYEEQAEPTIYYLNNEC